MGTIIVAVILFGLVGYAFYVRFLKKGSKGTCHECSEVGCPLADKAQMVQNRKMNMKTSREKQGVGGKDRERNGLNGTSDDFTLLFVEYCNRLGHCWVYILANAG